MFMLNQSGAKWTSKRKAKQFGQQRKLSVGDEKNHDSWKITIFRNHHEHKDYKAILAKKQKQFWIKPFITLCFASFIIFIIAFYLNQSKRKLIIKEQQLNQSIEDLTTLKSQSLIDAYNYNNYLGKSHLQSKNYDWAIYYFELALNSQPGDKAFYEQLVSACEYDCQLNQNNCNKIEKYEKRLVE